MTARKPQQPPISIEMQLKGLEWLWYEDAWRMVCIVCKGNCGQCGLTSLVGNTVPASMNAVIDKLSRA